MAGDHEYVRRSSFETGDVDDWSVSADCVALLSGSTVYLIGDDDDQIVLDEPGEYVALNDKLFVFADEHVEAYSISGTRLWSAELDDVGGLAAPEGSDVVVVLMDDERIVGLDAAAGHERFAHERPDADVATTPKIVCADESLVVASWSFLSILSPEGESRLRTTLDGAIHGVGVVGDTVVCVMKDDRLLGIETDSGDVAWRHDWDVNRIDPFGREELLVRTSDGIRAVTPDGDWTPLDLNDGLPIAAADGEPVCVLVDSLVNVYGKALPGDAVVETAVLADVVEPTAGSVPVEVENVGETMTVATVGVEATGATVPTGRERLTLAPGESERVRVRLSEVDAEAVDLAVSVDGDRDVETTLPVAGGMNALDVTAAPAAVDSDGWHVEVAVENTSNVPIRDVALSPGGRTRDSLEPGERWAVTVPLPADGAVVVATSDAERYLEVSVPDRPLEADIRFEEGVVVVDISNDSPAHVTDTLSITCEDFPRDLTLEFDGVAGSRLVAALPPVSAGELTVAVEGQLLSRTGTVSVPAGAVVGGQDTASGPTPRSECTSIQGRLHDDDPDAASTGRAGDDADGGGESCPLELDRRFDPEEPSLGELQFEYVGVTNTTAEPREVTVQSEDFPGVTAVVSPNESRSFVRAHTYTSEAVEIPVVSVVSERGRRSARAVEPSIQTPGWYCLAAFTTTADGPRLCVKVVNQSRTRVSVSDLSLESLSLVETPESFEVPPRSTETTMIPVSGNAADGTPTLLSFDAGADVASSTEYQTLVHAPDRDRQGLAHLDVTIDEETVLDDTGGTVVVRISNDGPTTIRGFSAEADNDQVRTMLYDSLTVESLEPGESVKHYIDVDGVEQGLDLPVELEITGGAAEVVSIVADSAEAAAVRVDRPSLADPGEIDSLVPDRISTAFEVESSE